MALLPSGTATETDRLDDAFSLGSVQGLRRYVFSTCWPSGLHFLCHHHPRLASATILFDVASVPCDLEDTTNLETIQWCFYLRDPV